MSGAPDSDRAPLRPFLIEVDEKGNFRLTARETRYNSQNYPIVTATLIDETFASAAAARAFANRNFGAAAGQFALPQRPPKRVSRG